MAEQSTNSPRPSNSPVIIAVVVLAVAGLVGLNVMANQARPKTDHEIEAEQKEASKPAASPAAAASPEVPENAPPGPPGGSGDPNSLVMMGQNSVLGNKDTKKEVVVGFAWTPEVQSDPSKVSASIDALQKSLGNQAQIKVVNVDEHPEVPEGVSLDGKLVVPADAAGAISPSAADTVKKALSSTP